MFTTPLVVVKLFYVGKVVQIQTHFVTLLCREEFFTEWKVSDKNVNLQSELQKVYVSECSDTSFGMQEFSIWATSDISTFSSQIILISLCIGNIFITKHQLFCSVIKLSLDEGSFSHTCMYIMECNRGSNQTSGLLKITGCLDEVNFIASILNPTPDTW